MRHFLLTLFFSLILCITNAQSSAEKFAGIIQTPEIAKFFDGLFEKLGVVVEETGEKVLITHMGDNLKVTEGFDSSEVDFILPLQPFNVSDMVDHSKDGKIDDIEATRIARVFFTPFTRVTLKDPVLTANRKRRAAGIEDLIHVYLMFPDDSVADSHTLIYAADQWVVIDGIVGKPERVFKLTQGPALEYQRQIFKAMKTDTRKGWMSFVKWYKKWRMDYSVTY